ncbi:lysosomal alpha-mannosidase-like [Bacillus rossius redtenbacheri]|uniref:lysosomal alpha-mannosidase-like n=1 Tax=Bacillus rossius redtenbacheri TaxID=93214 RepID=UPI002FDE32CE
MWTCGGCVLVAALLSCLATPGRGLPAPAHGSPPPCGYQSCPETKPGFLNVHLVPHSHDDVGWLKTADQYYYGNFNNIQIAGVQYIIDSVVAELKDDPTKRFIQVETAFFWQWWQEQDDAMKDIYRSLINSGQIEMIGGGWSMNDEAATHYQSTIDNFSWGLRRLNDTFGVCGRPRVGWQIDPFGHSRETASIMARMGFDGLFFGRLDYQDKNSRLQNRSMELMWRASADLGSDADLFTGVNFNGYSAPSGFCFDIKCSDEPIIEDDESPEYNVPRKLNSFVDQVKKQASFYATDNIMLTMGDDFNYMEAHMNYKNMDKLIRLVNEMQKNGSNLHLMYSTPSCYLKAVHDANLTLSVKSDDFFPYASDEHSYWTGYFTSRPTHKRFERLANNFLQVCKQLSVTGNVTGEKEKEYLDAAREAQGVLQHHDAITGTAKQAVADDYARIISEAIHGCQHVTKTAINNLLEAGGWNGSRLELESCLLLNISQCEASEGRAGFLVTVYNPLGRPVSPYVRVPVSGRNFTVTDVNGTEVSWQLVPVPQSVRDLWYRKSKASSELVFRAEQLPPLGFSSFLVTPSGGQSDTARVYETHIGNQNVTVDIDETTGLVSNISYNNIQIPLSQDFLYYVGAVGNNSRAAYRASGAYIFRPNSSEPLNITQIVNVTVYKGPLVEEIHQVFSDWVSQVIRIYKDEDFVEFEWQVGPIPDNSGKEVISRFSTSLASQGEFRTDSNGRESLLRRRNHRPTWSVQLEEPVSGNYYPVTSVIALQDEGAGLRLAVLTDRAQGGSSLHDGQLELMVHRRLFHDDAFGVGEALNEQAYGKPLVARGKHYLLLGDTASAISSERLLAQEILLAPWLFFSSPRAAGQWEKQMSGLKLALPRNVHVLTLEPWKDGTVLLRLEHIFQKSEDSSLSQAVTVNLQEFFSTMTVVSARETTLDGNQWLSATRRMQWRTDPPAARQEEATSSPGDSLEVSLRPMQIRTFVLEVK